MTTKPSANGQATSGASTVPATGPTNITDTGHIHVGKGLNTSALGIVGSTVISLASTAPLYSLAATLGWVILEVGEQAPVAFIAACIPMVFAALAYQELNREMPDCGTTFVWGTKAFGPIVGGDGARQCRRDQR